jgi:glutathione S-transferase
MCQSHYLTSHAMLRLLGHPVSQPTRAVAQLLFIKKYSRHDYVRLSPIAGDTVTPEFLSKWPFGCVPAIEDNGFCLSEGAAILLYLCESRGWTDWYPAQHQHQQRARCNEWLSWHHGALRQCTDRCFRLLMLAFMKCKHRAGVPSMAVSNDPLLPTVRAGMTREELDEFLRVLEHSVVADLVGNKRGAPFLNGDSPQICDLLSFCELDQLDELQLLDGIRSRNADFSAWMDRMSELPGHVEVRKPMKKLAAGIIEAGVIPK